MAYHLSSKKLRIPRTKIHNTLGPKIGKLRSFFARELRELKELAMPKISIIIPVYNTENYLVRCLESVCQQTEQNIEIIVVDDASPDNSWAIIQDYAARDSRIRAIRHPENKHLGGARNTGIEAVRSEWLLFLDSDDYLRLDAVEVLLNASKEYPQLELIVFGAWHVRNMGQLHEFGKLPTVPELLPDAFLECCKDGCVLHSNCGKLWKRSLFADIRFPEHMSMEDLATTPRLLAQVQKTLILPQRLYFYLYREDSLSNLYTDQTSIDFGRAFAILEEFATQLAPERLRLMENFTQRQFEVILQRKNDGLEFQTAFVRHAPPSLSAKTLWDLSDRLQDHNRLQQDRWYRFGRLSRKRKLWEIAKVLSKKMKIYKAMQPFAKVVKKIMKKREANA